MNQKVKSFRGNKVFQSQLKSMAVCSWFKKGIIVSLGIILLLFSEVTQANIPSHLVEIEMWFESPLRNRGTLREFLSRGTGFFYDTNTIVTSHHVVFLAQQALVKIKIYHPYSNQYIENDAKIYAVNSFYDLAVIKTSNSHSVHNYQPDCDSYTIGFPRKRYRRTPLRYLREANGFIQWRHLAPDRNINLHGASGSPIYSNCELIGTLSYQVINRRKVFGISIKDLNYLLTVDEKTENENPRANVRCDRLKGFSEAYVYDETGKTLYYLTSKNMNCLSAGEMAVSRSLGNLPQRRKAFWEEKTRLRNKVTEDFRILDQIQALVYRHNNHEDRYDDIVTLLGSL